MKAPFFLKVCITTLLVAGSVFAGSRNSENLLGPTGMVGKPNNKGITITKVEKGSPADGRVKPGDVILSVGKVRLNQAGRIKLAEAIDEAETTEAGGKLTLTLDGDRTVEIPLKVMGSYSDTAPYDCPKSEAIIRQAADYLAQSTRKGNAVQLNASKGQLETGWLGLMATGEPKFIEIVKQNLPLQDWAKPDRNLLIAQVKGDAEMRYVGWFWGYRLITLAEYHLLTGDKSVLPAIEAYAQALAMGQDAAGLWSHRMAVWSSNHNQPHGRCIGYGQMNQPSLTCFMGLLLAKKCGVKSTEIDGAIKRSHDYFDTYTGRGAMPYGVHDPRSRDFNNNGMSGSAALCMSFLGNRESAAYFSRCSAASHDRLESGHQTYYFNVLWTPLGANVAGPEVTRQFFKESRWLKTMYRSWDGSFTHDGGESKEGNSTGSQLLAYCLPRRSLYITGKEADESLWLKGKEATGTVQMSKINFTGKKPDELMAYLGGPFPQLALPAIDALRIHGDAVIPRLLQMIQTGTKIEKRNAIRFFGDGCPQELALPQLEKLGAILRDSNEELETRALAARALSGLGQPAFPYYQDMLRMVATEKPTDPFGLTDESLSDSLRALAGEPFAAGLVKDKDLFYAAVLKLMDHKRQKTRAEGIQMLSAMPLEDFHRVGEKLQYVIKDRDLTYHSYHNPTQAIGAGISILAGLNIKEGMDYILAPNEIASGKGSFKMKMMMDSLARYGAHARPYMEDLKQRPDWQKVPNNPKMRDHWERLVKAIEEDTDPANLITIAEAMAASGKK